MPPTEGRLGATWGFCVCANLYSERRCFRKGFPLKVVLIFFTGGHCDRIWGIYKNPRLQEARFVSLILSTLHFMLMCRSQTDSFRIKTCHFFKSSEKVFLNKEEIEVLSIYSLGGMSA